MRPTPGHAYVGPAHPRWTETLRDHMLPTLKTSFIPLEMSRDVFSWNPV